jgi:hypothetical protein
MGYVNLSEVSGVEFVDGYTSMTSLESFRVDDVYEVIGEVICFTEVLRLL